MNLWVFRGRSELARPNRCRAFLLRSKQVRTLSDHPKIHHRRVRVQAIGKLELLPTSLRAAIRAASEATDL